MSTVNDLLSLIEKCFLVHRWQDLEEMSFCITKTPARTWNLILQIECRYIYVFFLYIHMTTRIQPCALCLSPLQWKRTYHHVLYSKGLPPRLALLVAGHAPASVDGVKKSPWFGKRWSLFLGTGISVSPIAQVEFHVPIPFNLSTRCLFWKIPPKKHQGRPKIWQVSSVWAIWVRASEFLSKRTVAWWRAPGGPMAKNLLKAGHEAWILREMRCSVFDYIVFFFGWRISFDGNAPAQKHVS